ncbi:phosphoglycerate mutase [Corynebacterium hylobatis]|uniref:Phosphoglycerate mutase n=1 Tax=Corynebacterium hylobatis TaxID=1859290 RepID=A0A430I164_9CORY|nr:histidine phosphatase family protein [Corynebacterium hylobatis]RSZ65548.1 phosphoglycerate mutase [Corynebacterium hylobatis]
MGTDTISARPTLIVLVRHGVTPTTGQVLPGRAPGLHLSEAGQGQAREVAQRLQGLPLAALHTSPMERTRETAAPTAELFGLEPQVTDELVECDFGEWTGGKLAELAKLPEWQTVQKTPSEFRFPGGESFVEMQDRMVAVLDEIAARHPGGIVVCFSHADPIKAAVTHLAGRALDDFQRVAVDPASVSVVKYGADGATTMLETNSRSGPLLHLLEQLGEAGPQ